MKIETKYGIGQEVWYMEDNHTELGKICEITEEVCNYFYCCPIDTKHTFVKSDKKFEV